MHVATRLLAVLSCSAAASLAACGSRGPLDDGPIYVYADSGATTAEGDASADGAAPIADASVDAREAGVVQCGSCLVSQCGSDVLSCLGSTGCRTTLQCVVTTCLAGGGGFDLKCATGCAGSDPGAVLKIFQVLQCVTSDCGPECGSLLGGLLGGLGGGGGNGGGGNGGGKGGGNGGRQLTPIQEAFSVFPELRPPMALPDPR